MGSRNTAEPDAETPPPVSEAGLETVDGDDTLPGDAGAPRAPDLSGLSVAGITRRRLSFVAGAVVSVWVVFAFARQVGEASEATARVEDLRNETAALSGQVAALQRESELIQQQEWIAQQAHGYRLGSPGEIPFVLTDVSPLPPDAPGSASVRLGGPTDARTPLESWLSLLFGPSR